MKLNGPSAIATGAGSGLGAATARALAAGGARVALFDLSEEAAARVAAEIGGLAIPVDVSDAASGEAAFARAAAAHGPARILVNCAGVAPVCKVLGKQGLMSLDA